jgi:hypothetical protein
MILPSIYTTNKALQKKHEYQAIYFDTDSAYAIQPVEYKPTYYFTPSADI